MKIGVVGLGLIGGSLAKAIKQKTNHEVIGWDNTEQVRLAAIMAQAVDTCMENGNPKDCDVVLLALYPQATIDYVTQYAAVFKKNALVADCAGVKRLVCDGVQEIAKQHDFVFVGAHPMAGIERSGFTYSKADLFDGTTMILTPYTGTDIKDVNTLSMLCKSIGFGRMQVTTPQEHDQMIAYTSQLAHVVSSAYIKSELSPKFRGFSAGSFHDMTRVAKLNETMWTELFLENKDYLAEEIDTLIARLQAYSDAIHKGNAQQLKALLQDGKQKRLAIEENKAFD